MAVIKGKAYTAVIPARDATGTLVETSNALSVVISNDGGDFAAATQTIIPILGFGFKVYLTAQDMAYDTVVIKGTEAGLEIPVMMLSTEIEEKVLTEAYNPAKSAASDTAVTALGQSIATVDGIVDDIKLSTDRIPQSPAVAGGAMELTNDARTSLINSMWSALTSGFSTLGSIGKLLLDNIDNKISTRMAEGTVTVGGYAAGQTPAMPGDTMVPSVVTPVTNLTGIARTTDLANLATKTDVDGVSVDLTGVAMTTDINSAVTAIEAHGDANWVSADVTLTQEQIDALSVALTAAVGADLSTEIISGLTGQLTYYDSIKMGQGTGSVEWTDTLSSGLNPIRNAIVRAFPYTTSTEIDWNDLKARDTSDDDGEYTMYLNPGKYAVSVEKNGVQLSSFTINIAA